MEDWTYGLNAQCMDQKEIEKKNMEDVGSVLYLDEQLH